jgi:hypothetical protein
MVRVRVMVMVRVKAIATVSVRLRLGLGLGLRDSMIETEYRHHLNGIFRFERKESKRIPSG